MKLSDMRMESRDRLLLATILILYGVWMIADYLANEQWVNATLESVHHG